MKHVVKITFHESRRPVLPDPVMTITFDSEDSWKVCQTQLEEQVRNNSRYAFFKDSTGMTMIDLCSVLSIEFEKVKE